MHLMSFCKAVLSRCIVGCIILALAVVFTLSIQAFTVPAYDGLVNDYAEILSPEFEAQLESQLLATANATNGAELMVVTLTSLEGDTVENVSQEFFDIWKPGKKDLDNGVIFLVAVQDRKTRIHTGYGTETVVPDSIAGRILRTHVTPQFKDGHFEAGIQAGVTSLLGYLDNPAVWHELASNTNTPDSKPWWSSMTESGIVTFVIIFALLGPIVSVIAYAAAILGRTRGWWLGGLVGVGLGFLLFRLPGAIIFGLIGLAFDYVVTKNYDKWRIQKWPASWSKTWHSTNSSGSSSGGGSGYSSGGGSSGGGGASGSW